MRRFGLQLTGAAILVAFVATACSDSPYNPGPSAPSGERATSSIVAPPPGTCTTLSALTALVNTVFGPGSPNANSALGKLNNIDHHVNNGNFATAKEHAFTLVEFILDKYKLGGLPGTPAEVVALVNNLFCYAGLGIQITDPFNSFLVYPSDEAQILVRGDGLAGTSLPANPVSEPTLISIQLIPNTFTVPGQGPLNTKLDQYPGFVAVTKLSETNAPLTQPVVVGVCAAPSLSPSVRARLRLGHDASAGFEITPPADASFLNCPTTTSQRPGWLRSLASLILPKTLYARQDELFGGGVGGTAGEYSDFAPVDPELRATGGVGGTAGEYIRALPTRRAPLPNTSGFGMVRGGFADLISGNGCDPIEAPVGTPVDDACVPFVSISTHLGTPFVGVPVSWAVTAGGGEIAPRSLGLCGAFGATASTTTALSGKTGVCWTLGAAGTNSITATPSLGGDASEPGIVILPATVTFNAIANPPVGINFDQQPPSTVTAGSPFTVTAKVVDKYGNQVLGSSHSISLALNQFTFAGGSNSTSIPAVQGLATFTGLQINKAATGYQLSANAAFIASPFAPATSNLFDVVAAAPFSMAIVAGNNQTAPAGSVLPVNPAVAVSDQFGNSVPDVDVLWTPGGSSAGSVNPSLTETNALGRTFTAWTVGDGPNELTAAVVGAPSISQLFSANGTSSLVVLNQCAPGGSGDPINDPGKTFGFYIANPGNNKSIKEIQLYLSSSGKANAPTQYTIQLTTQIGTFDPAASTPVATTTNVFLRGNNSENKLTTFKLPTPIAGSGNGPPIMVRLAVLTNPDDAKINFNTGPCSPGSSCRPPPQCKATEVNSYTPYPAGTLYRKSVGITVKGN